MIGSTDLLSPRRLDRVDARCPPRGPRAGDEGNRRETHGRGREGCRVGRRYVEEQLLDEARPGERANEPETEARKYMSPLRARTCVSRVRVPAPSAGTTEFGGLHHRSPRRGWPSAARRPHRSTFTGSSRAARRAGARHAHTATIASSTATTTKLSVSSAATPYSSFER